MGDTALTEQIAAAARDMEGEFTPASTMDAAVKLSLQLVPGAQEASISLRAVLTRWSSHQSHAA